MAKKNIAEVKNTPTPAATPVYYYYAALTVIIIIIIIIRNNFLNIPFERDEGAYTYAGKSILYGAIPFKDIGSNRLPGVFYFYAVLVFIFGYSVKAMHIAFLFINILSVIILFLIGKKLLNPLAGLATATSFAFLSLSPMASGFTIQSEHIVVCSGFAGFLFLLLYMDKHKFYFLLISGLCFSIAFQTKQTSGLYVLFAAVLFLFHHFKKPINWKKMLVHAMLYALCFALPILFSMFIVWYRGGWDDYKIWMIEIQKMYISQVTFSDGLTYLKMIMVGLTDDYFYLWLIAFIGPVLIWFTPTTLFNKVFVSGIFVFCFFTVVPGYHYFSHYFLQWLPAVAVSVGASIFSIHSISGKLVKSRVAVNSIAIGIFSISVISNISRMKEYYFKPNDTKILRAVYGLNPFPESMVVAKYLNSLMKPEDELVVFGNEIEMYVYTNKIAPSRFAGSGALVEFPHSHQKEWADEFMKDVEKAAPKYMVFYDHANSWMTNPKSDLTIFTWFNKFSMDNYNCIGYADILDPQTVYLFGADEIGKRPTESKYRILVFQRKSNT